MWNKEETLRFHINKSDSAINTSGELEIEADTLDNIYNKKISFIKKDLEGAEYNALIGCKKTIQRDRPILAISIYYKPDDLWRLPCLIHEFNDEYKFYLRHYSLWQSETVLYAIPC